PAIAAPAAGDSAARGSYCGKRPADPRGAALAERVEKLAPSFAPPSKWRLSGVCLRRGFIESVELAGHNFPFAEEVFRTHPVRRVRLVRARGCGFAVAGFAPFARLTSLELGEVDPADLTALAASPHFGGLRELALHCQRVPEILALTSSATLPRVTA